MSGSMQAPAIPDPRGTAYKVRFTLAPREQSFCYCYFREESKILLPNLIMHL